MEEKEDRHANRKSASHEWPWWAQFFLAVIAMALAALFLIGLPYYVMSAENWRNPGTATAPSGAWTAMIPVLIGFTTMTISGIFLFMTFRIDRGAKAEARDTAKKVAEDIIGEKVQSEMKKQLGARLIDAKQRADIHFAEVDRRMEARYAEVDRRMEARYDVSDKRMEARISSFDERLTVRFEDADERIKERFKDADERIKERFEDAAERFSEQVADARKPNRSAT